MADEVGCHADIQIWSRDTSGEVIIAEAQFFKMAASLASFCRCVCRGK